MPELKQFKTRKEWLEARKQGIGGSDAPAIVGVDPFRSALEVYAEKVGDLSNTEENEAMLWGRKLEPLVAQAYRETTKRKLQKFGHHYFLSTARPFAFASLDRLIVEPQAVLEIKTSNYLKEDEIKEEIPLHFQVQLQHALGVMGFEVGSFAILLNARRLFWVDVPADKEFIELLFEKEAAFWKRVQAQSPPPPDASESARETLRRMYPKDSGDIKELPPEAVEWDRIRAEAEAEIKRWNEQKAQAENNIKAAMGEATFGVFGGVKYSWKTQQRAGYTVAPSEVRVLRRVKNG